jgi:hypothetical protein
LGFKAEAQHFDCARKREGSTMLFKIFRKQREIRPKFEQDPSLVAALEQRVREIQFQPSRGFLKDRPLPKRTPPPPAWSRK